jgi:hypothetical protein
MAEHDFMPFRTMGGSEERFPVLINGSQGFYAGEPIVVIGSVGRCSESASDPSTVFGIAAERSLDRRGDSRPINTNVTLYGVGPNIVYKTKNFATDGQGTQATTISTGVIGDYAGLIKTGDDWFLDTGANNQICEVMSLANAQGDLIGNPNTLSAGGALWIFFRFIL